MRKQSSQPQLLRGHAPSTMYIYTQLQVVPVIKSAISKRKIPGAPFSIDWNENIYTYIHVFMRLCVLGMYVEINYMHWNKTCFRLHSKRSREYEYIELFTIYIVFQVPRPRGTRNKTHNAHSVHAALYIVVCVIRINCYGCMMIKTERYSVL